MGRPKKEESTEAVTPTKEKKATKSFDKFWDKYVSEKIFNASDREKQIAMDAAEAAWNA